MSRQEAASFQDRPVSTTFRAKEKILDLLGIPIMEWKVLWNDENIQKIFSAFRSMDDLLHRAPAAEAKMFSPPETIV